MPESQLTNANIGFLTPSPAAAILKVSEATVREYARKGIIRARKIGRHWRFLESRSTSGGSWESRVPHQRFTAPQSPGTPSQQSSGTDRKELTEAIE